MQITHLETFPVRIPLKPARRMITALGEHNVSDYLLVRVRTDAGIEGVGEATVMPNWSGETVASSQALIERVLSRVVIGADPTDVADVDRRMDRVCRHNWFTKAAIEMACWDIAGKAAGKPVYELLGGNCRPLTVRSRFSMGAYDLPRATARAAELVAEGFTTIKVKVGGPVAADVARVRAVREVIGPELGLTIDANCGWTPDAAIEAVNQLDDCRISLNEQPTPDGDYGGMARVRRATKPPVMADDMVFNLIHAQELIRNQCCDAISVYPGKNGGILRSRAICEFAAQHGVVCSIGSNLEWDIGTAAMMHLIVSTPNMQVERFPGDVLGPSYHEFSIVREPVAIAGPLTTCPSRPGLGVDVDWDVVKKHTI